MLVAFLHCILTIEFRTLNLFLSMICRCYPLDKLYNAYVLQTYMISGNARLAANSSGASCYGGLTKQARKMSLLPTISTGKIFIYSKFNDYAMYIIPQLTSHLDPWYIFCMIIVGVSQV